MKKLLALSLIGVFGLPLSSYAATYHYIDVTGTVRDIDAPSAAHALSYVSALPSTIHSGVALDRGYIDEGDSFGNLYLYRTNLGTYATVQAATFDAARLLASNRAPNSGLYLVR